MKQYFRITIPEVPTVSEELTAYELKALLADKIGIDLPVICNGGAPCLGDIVIGNQTFQLQGHKYKICGKDGVLRIGAASEYGYQSCMLCLQDAILQLQGELNEPVHFEGDASENFRSDTSCYYVTHREGDARVMLFNIYGWNGYGGIPLRTRMQQSLIASYLPDVVGFQEFGDFSEKYNCRSALTKLLAEIGYFEVKASHEDGTNCTPLFYNSTTVRLKEDGSCGYFRYSGPNDANSKSLTWAVFETKKNKKTFCAISTHFMWSQPQLPDPNSVRIENAKELLTVVAQIRKDYGSDLPVIAGGDLNCAPANDPAQVLMQGGLKWFYDIAEESQEYGYPYYPTYDEEKRYYTRYSPGPKYEGDGIEKDVTIDLIVGSGKMKVLTYITVNDKYALCSSDHAPKMTDVRLN